MQATASEIQQDQFPDSIFALIELHPESNIWTVQLHSVAIKDGKIVHISDGYIRLSEIIFEGTEDEVKNHFQVMAEGTMSSDGLTQKIIFVQKKQLEGSQDG